MIEILYICWLTFFVWFIMFVAFYKLTTKFTFFYNISINNSYLLNIFYIFVYLYWIYINSIPYFIDLDPNTSWWPEPLSRYWDDTMLNQFGIVAVLLFFWTLFLLFWYKKINWDIYLNKYELSIFKFTNFLYNISFVLIIIWIFIKEFCTLWGDISWSGWWMLGRCFLPEVIFYVSVLWLFWIAWAKILFSIHYLILKKRFISKTML
jgi:hypothetical protein